MPRRFFLTALALSALLFGAAGQSRAENIFITTSQNRLVSFDSATPGTTKLNKNISGLQAGEVVVGIDYRPATGDLYAVTNASRIYTINRATGAATFVSTLTVPLSGSAFGTDFNPMVDRLRVVSNADQNLRVNVDTGFVGTPPPMGTGGPDGTLAFMSGDANFGQNPNIEASAYTNNVAGAPSTVLYGIDTNLGVLVTQTPANSGQLQTVGSLGFGTTELAAFDISGVTGTAFGAFNPTGGFSSLYSVNLGSGAASLIGQIGSGLQVGGLAVAPAAVPEPTTMLLLGTGLAGISAAVRKRRQVRKDEEV